METKPAPKLDDDARAFVVQRLACFDPPSAVVKEVREPVRLRDRRPVGGGLRLDKRAGRSLSERWRTIFETARAAFLAETASIGIAHKSVRLRKLDQMLVSTMRQGNFALAMQILEQAAKEMGGMYTNRRELTGGRTKAPDRAAPAVVIYPAPEAIAAVREIWAAELH